MKAVVRFLTETVFKIYIMRKIILILLSIIFLSTASAQWNPWSYYNNTANNQEVPLQKLDGSLSGNTLLDVSGNGYNGKLVNSYMAYPQLPASVSSSPTTEGFTCRDFSISMKIKPAYFPAFSPLFSRCNGTGWANMISTLMVYSGTLTYISANGVSNSTNSIKALTVDSTYNVQIKFNNTGQRLSWVINGVTGSASFVNYTPSTAVTSDVFYFFNDVAGSRANYCKVSDVKFYSDTTYTNLTHWYPCGEGNGVVLYDVVGTKNIVLPSAANLVYYKEQSDLHYNWTKGFQLYGNDTNIIRVPYKSNGTKITPTINAYTKYADCDAGAFNNFAESGIKRNPTNITALKNLGIDTNNVIYFMGANGYDSLSYCTGFGTQETNWQVYSTKKDRSVTFATPQYMGAYVNYLVAQTGIRNFTTITKALKFTTGTIGTPLNVVINTGIYNEQALRLKNYTHLIGVNKETCIINGAYTDNEVEATIQNNSTLEWSGITSNIANLTLKGTNLRYVIHDDGIGGTKSITNCTLIHYGNAGADTYRGHTVWAATDAFGHGFQGTTNSQTLNVINVTATGKRYGWASHTNTGSATYGSIMNFSNCTFYSTSAEPKYSFRISYAYANGDVYILNNCIINGGAYIEGAVSPIGKIIFNNTTYGSIFCQQGTCF